MAPSPKAKKNNSRKAKAPPSATPASPRTRRLGQEMTAVLLLGLAAFLLLSLWTWTLGDPQDLGEVWNAIRVHNWGGKAGAYLSRHLLAALGVAAFWLPLLLAGLAWKSYRVGLGDLSRKQAAR